MDEKKPRYRDVPVAPRVYHPDTEKCEPIPGMGTYVGCTVCERSVVPEWAWCPYCGQRLAW